MGKTSPFVPARFPPLPPVEGVRFAVHAAAIRYTGRPDVLLAHFAEGTTVAGVFTRSQTAAAPVRWCQAAIAAGGHARALVVNAGNANAATGAEGERAAAATAAAAAELFGCRATEVMVASTGVIGERLPVEKLQGCLREMAGNLAANDWPAAARAIATTDTFPKASVRTARIVDQTTTIVGIAKGSGMIAPDMATMLAFLFTDAAIPAATLRTLLSDAADRSFNCITVDGDTSTNDTLLLFATGGAGNRALTAPDAADADDFRRALEEVCEDLAQQIVKDGEGVSKFVTIGVTGADSDAAARRIALTIANSPLVKTAIAGEDANWGRIIMAVGRSQQRIDREKLAVMIGSVPVCRNGAAVPGYDETPVAAHMRGREIDIRVDVGIGDGRATVWTGDLTHDYIDINASYRS